MRLREYLYEGWQGSLEVCERKYYSDDFCQGCGRPIKVVSDE